MQYAASVAFWPHDPDHEQPSVCPCVDVQEAWFCWAGFPQNAAEATSCVHEPFHVHPSLVPVASRHRDWVFVPGFEQYAVETETEHAEAESQLQPSACPPVAVPAAPVPWQKAVVWFAASVHAPVTVEFTVQLPPQEHPSWVPVKFVQAACVVDVVQ
jgi:hypothetical protein